MGPQGPHKNDLKLRKFQGPPHVPQNGPKMDPKCSKIEPKWSPKGSNMDLKTNPKWIQNQTKQDAELSQRHCYRRRHRCRCCPSPQSPLPLPPPPPSPPQTRTTSSNAKNCETSENLRAKHDDIAKGSQRKQHFDERKRRFPFLISQVGYTARLADDGKRLCRAERFMPLLLLT